jgi:hypothetical protein
VYKLLYVLLVILNLNYTYSSNQAPILKDYIDRFEKECNCKVDVQIKMGYMEYFPGYVIGECRMYPMVPRQIVINETTWPHMTDMEKEMLVFHELGHCYLGREHTEELKDDSFLPKSIMYPSVFSYPHYLKQYYINELFN